MNDVIGILGGTRNLRRISCCPGERQDVFQHSEQESTFLIHLEQNWASNASTQNMLECKEHKLH